MVLLCLDKSSLPTAMMSMRLFVFVSVLVNSCIVLSTTTAKALDSCAISGGIQFSYQDYVTVSAASIMTVAARNDGRQSKAKQSKKKKPAKIATPEEVEEKKQERLRKQRESVEERRRQSKKPAKIDTPEEVAEKKQERLRKQREVEARRRQSKKVELTPEEKSEKRLQQRRNANSTSRSSSKHLPVTTENDFRRRSRHHQQIEAVQEAPSRQNHSNDDPTNQNVPHPRTWRAFLFLASVGVNQCQ
jgi:flagellar biosynthesis GTPase FlhF